MKCRWKFRLLSIAAGWVGENYIGESIFNNSKLFNCDAKRPDFFSSEFLAACEESLTGFALE